MSKKSPVLVLILGLITCGIYHLYWLVATKGEMNRNGATIPTAWLIIVPFVNLYWLWRWAEGVQKVCGFSGVGAFVLILLLGPIGEAVIQSAFNKASAAPAEPAQT